MLRMQNNTEILTKIIYLISSTSSLYLLHLLDKIMLGLYKRTEQNPQETDLILRCEMRWMYAMAVHFLIDIFLAFSCAWIFLLISSTFYNSFIVFDDDDDDCDGGFDFCFISGKSCLLFWSTPPFFLSFIQVCTIQTLWN